MTWAPVSLANGYVIHWRPTDANEWTESRSGGACIISSQEHPPEGYVNPSNCWIILHHIRVDDWVFGVSSVSKDGFESPVASAVPGGAFKPYVAPPKK